VQGKVKEQDKTEELIGEFEKREWIELTTKYYPELTHNALFLNSFY
jgi:hypothetical protein